MVKRIWTPSWVLFSGGWCFLFLAGFYAVLDVLGVRFWAFPLRVIGMNSIAAYCMAGLWEGFIARNLTIHLGKEPFTVIGHPYEPLLHGAAVLAGPLADPVLDVPAQAVFEDLMGGRLNVTLTWPGIGSESQCRLPAKEESIMETPTMGKVLVTAKIENLEDLYQCRARGLLRDDQVRRIEVQDAVIDTGATTLLLPKRMIAALGLKASSHASLAWARRRAFLCPSMAPCG